MGLDVYRTVVHTNGQNLIKFGLSNSGISPGVFSSLFSFSFYDGLSSKNLEKDLMLFMKVFWFRPIVFYVPNRITLPASLGEYQFTDLNTSFFIIFALND